MEYAQATASTLYKLSSSCLWRQVPQPVTSQRAAFLPAVLVGPQDNAILPGFSQPIPDTSGSLGTALILRLIFFKFRNTHVLSFL